MLALPPGHFCFRFIRLIGVGGLGQVHEVEITQSNAFHLSVGSRHAAKQLNEQWNQHPTMQQRFEREIEAVKKMQHPNIIPCFGENLPDGQRFYLMPLFENTLRRLIASGRYTGHWREVAGLGANMADALAYAHGVGFIHRDLKPDNVLFNGGGPLVIADWGLGYFIHKHSKVLQQLTRGGMGTEYYCSLEQWNTGKCNSAGDVYSLGMTLDEFVRGEQRPITVGTGVRSPSVPATTAGAVRFNQLIQRMTQVIPANRPSMAQVIAELKAISTQT